MSPEREKAIKKHLNRKIRKFKKQLLELAIKNDHPYIESYLDFCFFEIKKTIGGNPMMSGDEMVIFCMNL